MNDDKPVTLALLTSTLTSPLAAQKERSFKHIDQQEQRLLRHIGNSLKELREYIDERTHDAETHSFSDHNNGASIRSANSNLTRATSTLRQPNAWAKSNAVWLP